MSFLWGIVIPVRTLQSRWMTDVGKNGGSNSNLLPLDGRTTEVLHVSKENEEA